MKYKIKQNLTCAIIASLLITPIYSVYAANQNNRGSSSNQNGRAVYNQNIKNIRGNKPAQNQLMATVSPIVSPTTSPTDKSCQKREQMIQKRSSQLVRMATNMLQVFEGIAQKVRTYYLTVVIPSGQSLDEYDELLVDIEAASTSVQGALEDAANSASAFDCENNDPKQQLKDFRHDMNSVKQALRTYRTSIKDLIVGVRTVKKPKTSPVPDISPTTAPSVSPPITSTPTIIP